MTDAIQNTKSTALSDMMAASVSPSEYPSISGPIAPGHRVTSFIYRNSENIGDVRTLFSYETDSTGNGIKVGVNVPNAFLKVQNAFFLNMLWNNFLVGRSEVQIDTFSYDCVEWPSDADSVIRASMMVESIGSTNRPTKLRLASFNSINTYLKANPLANAVITLSAKE